MTTLGQYIANLGFGDEWCSDDGKVNFELFRWPPDVFAMAASVLKKSGAYIQSSREHDYRGDEFDIKQWVDTAKEVADSWKLPASNDEDPPQRVCDALNEVAKLRSSSLDELSRQDKS